MIRTYYRQPYPYARYQPRQRSRQPYQPRYDVQIAPRWVDQFVRDLQTPPTAESQPTPLTPAAATVAWEPPIAVTETPTQFTLQIELPGVPASDINLEATQETLRIYGERRRPDATGQGRFPVGNAARTEFRYGPFARTLQFGVAIDPHGITSDRQAGIVTLQIPKLAAQQPKTVKVAITAPTPPIAAPEAASAANNPVAMAASPTTVIPLPSPQLANLADLEEDPWAASA